MNERAEVFHEMTEAYASALEALEAEGLTLNSETLTEPDIAALVEHYASLTRVPRQTQETIMQMEDAKRRINAELNEELDAIREGRPSPHVEKGAARVFATADGGFTVQHGQTELHLTEGDLLTNGEWGIEYSLDPVHVPPRVREAYVVEHAKRKVRELVDRQILTLENARAPKTSESSGWKGNVWQRLAKANAEQAPGRIAERMVRTYLKKAAIDFHLPYTILESDLYQDCLDKIDFIVHVTDTGHTRGVDVQEGEKKERDIVVQFTMNTAKVEDEKRREIQSAPLRERLQAQGVDDAIVVRVPMGRVSDDYGRWSDTNHALGPTAYWTNRERHEVLTAVLQNILDDEELQRASELLPRNRP